MPALSAGTIVGPLALYAFAVAAVTDADDIELQLSELSRSLPERINADPESAGQELGRLVLTLVEVLRKVLEHQAVRRMDSGALSPEEIERFGLALLRLNERMDELKPLLALNDEDLDIDLGTARPAALARATRRPERRASIA